MSFSQGEASHPVLRGMTQENIFYEEELEEAATTGDFSVVQKEGTRNVACRVRCYNSDAIIAVGYRVNSKKAVRFRQWILLCEKTVR